MKNKIFFLIFIAFVAFSNCSKQIKRVEISDGEFLFNIENYKKHYNIETYLKTFDVGVRFNEPISKDKIKLGCLEVIIGLCNDQEQRTILTPDVRYFYSDYENEMVNKIYFQSIILDDKEFINEVEVSVINAFDFSEGSELLISNLNSEFFFDQ